jgi:hypothetical protein
MFQNICIFQKISDFDISGTCGGEKIQVYKKKNKKKSRIHKRQLGRCKEGMEMSPAVFFLTKGRCFATGLNRSK